VRGIGVGGASIQNKVSAAEERQAHNALTHMALCTYFYFMCCGTTCMLRGLKGLR